MPHSLREQYDHEALLKSGSVAKFTKQSGQISSKVNRRFDNHIKVLLRINHRLFFAEKVEVSNRKKIDTSLSIAKTMEPES